MKINFKRAISPLCVLIIWEGVAHTGWIDQYFLPPLSTVLGTLYTMICTGEVFPHIFISIYRGLSGYIYAAVAGISLGLCIASSRLMEHISDPLIELLRPISTFALVPLMFVWFGVGESSKIILIAKACFFPIVLNTIAGIKGVDAKMVQAARSLGAEGIRLWINVLIPAAMPMIVTGLRISTAIALLSIVGMEMIASDSGIGFLIVDAQRVFATDRMFAGIIIIAILGFYVDRTARYFQQRFMGWHVETSIAANKI